MLRLPWIRHAYITAHFTPMTAETAVVTVPADSSDFSQHGEAMMSDPRVAHFHVQQKSVRRERDLLCSSRT